MGRAHCRPNLLSAGCPGYLADFTIFQKISRDPSAGFHADLSGCLRLAHADRQTVFASLPAVGAGCRCRSRSLARNPRGVAIRFWRRSWEYSVAVLLALSLRIQGGKWLHERIMDARLPVASPGSPNLLVLVMDTLRADHLSTYGYARTTSPALDRLAKHGMLFENAIAPCSWSLPSHASLLTGRYPLEHGLVNVQPMPWLGWGRTAMNGYPTLGEALQQRGYRTGAFSANRVYFSRRCRTGARLHSLRRLLLFCRRFAHPHDLRP